MWLGRGGQLSSERHQVAGLSWCARTNYSPLAARCRVRGNDRPELPVGPLRRLPWWIGGTQESDWWVRPDPGGIVCLIPVVRGSASHRDRAGLRAGCRFVVLPPRPCRRAAASGSGRGSADRQLRDVDRGHGQRSVGYSLGGCSWPSWVRRWPSRSGSTGRATWPRRRWWPRRDPAARAAGAGAAGEGAESRPKPPFERDGAKAGASAGGDGSAGHHDPGGRREYGIGALMALSRCWIASLVSAGRTPRPPTASSNGHGPGLVVGGVVLGGLAARLPKGPAIIVAFTAFGLVLVAFALTGNLLVAMVLRQLSAWRTSVRGRARRCSSSAPPARCSASGRHPTRGC